MRMKTLHFLPRRRFFLSFLILISSILWSGCTLLTSEDYHSISLRGKLSKIERFYVINTGHYQFDTTSLAGHTLYLDSLKLTTDSLGYFSSDSLSAGCYQLHFSAPGFHEWDTTISLPETSRLTISVQPVDSGFYQFKGTLHYLANRSDPIPNTVSSARLNAGDVPIYLGNNWKRTNPDGSFHFSGIKQGTYKFGVYSNTFQFKDTTIQLNQNITFNPLMTIWDFSEPLSTAP